MLAFFYSLLVVNLIPAHVAFTSGLTIIKHQQSDARFEFSNMILSMISLSKECTCYTKNKEKIGLNNLNTCIHFDQFCI